MGKPQRIDVAGLLAGGRHDLAVRQRVALPAFRDLEFPRAAEVALDLEGIDRRLLITGTVDVSYRGRCDRCLTESEHGLHVDVDEELAPSSPDVREADPLGESNVLTGTELDLGDLVRQLVDSALPLTMLCAASCRGLCTRCGANLNEGACDCRPAGDRAGS